MQARFFLPAFLYPQTPFAQSHPFSERNHKIAGVIKEQKRLKKREK